MSDHYIVEMAGEFYGPFSSQQAAAQFADGHFHINAMVVNKVLVLRPPESYTNEAQQPIGGGWLG